MKTLISVLIAVLLLSTAAVVNAHTQDDPLVTPLIADGGEPPGINVGAVVVWNDPDNLYIQFVILDPDWVLVETHMHVALTVEGIPQKNGNPQPGHFDYSSEYAIEDGVQLPDPLVIPLNDWAPCETDLVIAAHAVVMNVAERETITVVSDETNEYWSGAAVGDIDGFGYIVPPGSWSSATFCWEHSSWNSSLSPAGHKAKLFASPAADWIWGPVEGSENKISLAASYTGDIVFFKKEIEIPEPAYDLEAELLLMTVDNAYYFYVNDGWSGMPKGYAGFNGSYGPTDFYYISNGVDNFGGGTNSVPHETVGNLYPYDASINTSSGAWSSIEQWDITSSLHSGQNELQIVAINEHAPPQAPENNPAGLIYKAEISYLWWDETAWGDGDDFPGKNWATYFGYHVQDCEDPVLVNGDFETPGVAASEGWDIYDSGTGGLGWTVEWASSYGGAPFPAHLELHNGVNGWLPYEGSQHAELDTDWGGPGHPQSGEPASVKIYQDINTCAGWTYTLQYAWSPRPGHGDNAIDVYWNGTCIASHSGSGGANTSWTLETHNGLAASSTESTTRLEFIETGTADSLGMFLDAVSVTIE
jgi:hypothetical protein